MKPENTTIIASPFRSIIVITGIHRITIEVWSVELKSNVKMNIWIEEGVTEDLRSAGKRIYTKRHQFLKIIEGKCF